MADSGNPNKRAREDEEGERGEAKRLRAEELLEILDGDDAAAAEELASVMRSFEEEIAAAPPPPPIAAAAAEVAGDGREMDLGYLLEASDDELGLPPTTTTTTAAAAAATTTTTTTVTEDSEAAAAAEEDDGVVGAGGLGLGLGLGLGFGEMWGFEDEIGGCYEGFGFGMSDAAEEAPEHHAGAGAGAGGGVVVLGFDGGLFDYSDVVCGPSDLADLSWRSESLPAV